MKIIVALAVVAAAIAAPSAMADGLPVLGVDVGADGVTVPAAHARYVALPSPQGTLLARISLPTGHVVGFRYLPGNLTIPALAYDGTAGGLSADAGTLAVLTPRRAFPRERTRLAVLDAVTLRTRRIVALRGDYSFDAISPDGAWLYFVHYLSQVDPTVYEVRAYDVRRGRLLAEPIVDPQETGEQMRGNPLTRTPSADGRWAYTLYDGLGKPFVHALDTAGRTARCIDLDALAGRNLNGARLSLDGRTLTVRSQGRAVALIDTRTFAVRPPELRVEAVQETSRGQRIPWLPLLGVAALLVGAGIASLLALRSRSAGLGRTPVEE